MSSFRYSRRAQADLDEIWEKIALEGRPETARRVIQTITAKVRALAETPGMGRERPELASGIRAFPVYNFLIVYRTENGGIGIARVVHGARNSKGWLEEGSFDFDL